MIICQCNVIADADVKRAVRLLLEQDPYRVITPGQVYRTLGRTGKCCGCFPAVIDIIADCQKQFWSQLSTIDEHTRIEKEL